MFLSRAKRTWLDSCSAARGEARGEARGKARGEARSEGCQGVSGKLMTHVPCTAVHFCPGMESLDGLRTVTPTEAGDSRGLVEAPSSGWTNTQMLSQAFQVWTMMPLSGPVFTHLLCGGVADYLPAFPVAIMESPALGAFQSKVY